MSNPKWAWKTRQKYPHPAPPTQWRRGLLPLLNTSESSWRPTKGSGDKDMPFHYLGRKKPNKFLTLSLSIIITIKENKDLDRDHWGGPVWGGAHMGGLSTGSAQGHPSVTSAIRARIWYYNTISNNIVKYAGGGRINRDVVWKVRARTED